MDKPGRRRKRGEFPWRKVASAAVVVLLVAAAGWFVYQTYIYKPPPVYATVATTLGSFDVELYPACAPKTVANFVSLAQSGFYDNIVWHRIVPGFIVQTGDPNSRGGQNSTRPTWGAGGSNQTVPLEWCGWLHNLAGYLGMARQSGNVNSGTSQFYVNLSNSSSNLSLDGNYTVFGRVISGWSVIQAIANPSNVCQSPECPINWPPGEPITPVFITSVTILSAPPETSSGTA